MLVFTPFTKETSDIIRPWFEDSDTRKWLGDRTWVDMELEQQAESIGKEFRGVTTVARYAWVVFDGAEAVGYIDGSIGDKYVKYGGMVDDKPIYLETEEKPSSGIAFVVNPGLRGKGYATQMIRQLLTRPEFVEVEIFEAGVEPGNIGSVHALEKAGFASDYVKDFEGMYYFLLRK